MGTLAEVEKMHSTLKMKKFTDQGYKSLSESGVS